MSYQKHKIAFRALYTHHKAIFNEWKKIPGTFFSVQLTQKSEKMNKKKSTNKRSALYLQWELVWEAALKREIYMIISSESTIKKTEYSHKSHSFRTEKNEKPEKFKFSMNIKMNVKCNDDFSSHIELDVTHRAHRGSPHIDVSMDSFYVLRKCSSTKFRHH